VSPRPAPEALLPWALSVLGQSSSSTLPALSVVAGDASNRRYFRFDSGPHSYVLVEAPPETEKNEEFLHVRSILASAGVRVPNLLGADLDRGFLLLEDLGDQLLLPLLDADSVNSYYRSAMDVLSKLAQTEIHDSQLGEYDHLLLSEELGRFSEWFVQGLLGYSLPKNEEGLLRNFFAQLVNSALEQPRVVVHRDFHSRNLMLMADDSLAVIDFQDAVIGPVTYDLVSLLRDCYIQWPPDRVEVWVGEYRDLLHSCGVVTDSDRVQFQRWFDLMGLQRHIKVLGTFARLYLRDGKSAYLDDLPLVVHYVLEVLEKYSQESVFADFHDWFCQCLSPLIAAQEWSNKQ
jgi:aminoglycoside/choline kinase family phosphotransferase